MNPFNYNLGQSFASTYYEKMSKGISNALTLFDPNVTCIIDNDAFSGAYEWLIRMAQSNAARFEYDNISGASQFINHSDILVNINGNLKVIGIHGQLVSNWIKFNEVFVLEKKPNDNRLFIKNYILKILR